MWLSDAHRGSQATNIRNNIVKWRSCIASLHGVYGGIYMLGHQLRVQWISRENQAAHLNSPV